MAPDQEGTTEQRNRQTRAGARSPRQQRHASGTVVRALYRGFHIRAALSL